MKRAIIHVLERLCTLLDLANVMEAIYLLQQRLRLPYRLCVCPLATLSFYLEDRWFDMGAERIEWRLSHFLLRREPVSPPATTNAVGGPTRISAGDVATVEHQGRG
ncbi:MAG: hypothetical protein GEU28_01940 [Dehalococcoidia bacterium]|nr:hypothetical protein [Dehalococcoidia bacterium]